MIWYDIQVFPWLFWAVCICSASNDASSFFNHREKCFYFINKRYKGPTLRPPCDIIDDVITMKNTFCDIIWDDLFISHLISNLCLIFQHFQNGRHCEVAASLLPEVIPEVEYASKIAMCITYILLAKYQCSSWNIDGDISISKSDLLCALVRSSMTSRVHET